MHASLGVFIRHPYPVNIFGKQKIFYPVQIQLPAALLQHAILKRRSSPWPEVGFVYILNKTYS